MPTAYDALETFLFCLAIAGTLIFVFPNSER